MKTKPRFFLTLATLMLLLAFAAVGSAAKKVVAVMPIENVSGWGEQRVAQIMTEQLTDALYKSGRATVVERNQLGNALREIGFDMTGAVDPNTAVQAGRMIGAEYSLIGKVTMASVNVNHNAQLAVGFLGALGGAVANLAQGHVAVNIRLINNETGELVKSVDAEGHETGKTAEAALHNACKEAAQNFLEEIIGKFVGVIIDVEGDIVYIDAGSEQGVRKGETFEIVKEGRPIAKPDGTMIMKYLPIGKLKVVEVNTDHAICKITDHEGGLSIAKGAIVRRIKK